MSNNIAGKVVVITGASSGLGGSGRPALPNTIIEPDVAERMRRFYGEFAIPADLFARAVAIAISQPEDVDINEILYRPTRQEL